MKIHNYVLLVCIALAIGLFSCKKEDDQKKENNKGQETPGNSGGETPKEQKKYYFMGVETGTDPSADILSAASSLTEGTVSPVNNGVELAAFTTYVQGIDKIFTLAYSSNQECGSFYLKDGKLQKGESLFTDMDIYTAAIVDKDNMILVGAPRVVGDKKIYHIDTQSMSIKNTVSSSFGNLAADSLLAFPNGAVVRGDKLFISYYLINSSFGTPKVETAEVAVFSYPGLAFEKIIKDNRVPSVGRYASSHSLQMDENKDIYTYAPSSLACGYAPVPKANSGILRIKNGETEFDKGFHIDFEKISGGYKINDMFYVADGKAVVRVLKEDESNFDLVFKSYNPSGEASELLLETGILDLNTSTFTLLPNVPKGGGGWQACVHVEGTKAYLGVSSKDFADIYVVDVATGTATKGAKVDGNYGKAILMLKE